MREFIAYLDPKGVRYETGPQQFDIELKGIGFELQPLVGIITKPSWKRTRKIGGVTIEDHINYCSGHDGGCGILRHTKYKNDPGLRRILNYKVLSLPAIEHRGTPISDSDWEGAVEALRRDLSGLFDLYDESSIQEPQSQ